MALFRAVNAGSPGYNPSGISGITIPKPSGVVAGDALIVSFVVNDTHSSIPGLTHPSGWTQLWDNHITAGGTNYHWVVAWKTAGASEPSSYSWSWTGSDATYADGTIAAFYVVNAATPIAAYNYGAPTTTTSHVAPSLTAPYTNCLDVLLAVEDNYNSWSSPAGYTERFDNSGFGMTWSDKQLTSSGATGTRTMTSGSSGGGQAAAILLNDATPAGGGANGSAIVVLSAVVISSTGNVPVKGQAGVSLVDIGVTASGAGGTTGAASIALDDVGAAGAGVVAISGETAVSLADTAVSATGVVDITGAASIALADVGAAGVGVVPVTGQTAVSLADTAVSAAGVLPITGAGSIALDDVDAAGAGEVVGADIVGAASIALDDVGATGVGAVAIEGVTAVSLGNVTVAGAGVVAVEGSGAIVLEDAACSATGAILIVGSAGIELADAGLIAAGTVGDEETVEPTYGTVQSPGAAGSVSSPDTTGFVIGPLAASWDFLLTEDGYILTTEDGYAIETEGSSLARAGTIKQPTAVGVVITQR